MLNKITLIGRLGQDAEARHAHSNREYVILNVDTQERWKNNKGEYETRTEWHRVYAWPHLAKYAARLRKGQLITLEGTLRYREVVDVGAKHRIAEIFATSLKRLSKVQAAVAAPTGGGRVGGSSRWVSSRAHPLAPMFYRDRTSQQLARRRSQCGDCL